VGDLLRWARFHLGGDGVLPAETLHGMRPHTRQHTRRRVRHLLVGVDLAGRLFTRAD
jgi:hypothetical protein